MSQIGVDAGSYTFNAVAGTVTFSGVTINSIDQIKLINNVVDGIIIYNPLDPSKLGTLAANVLTLSFDTSAMDNADELFICVNLGGEDLATETTLEAARVLLASLDSKDYATQNTLEAARVLLASLDSKDYATETTLAAIKTKTDLLTFTADKLKTTGEDGGGGTLDLTNLELNTNRAERLLNELLEAQNITNKLLRKIYNHE